MPELTLLHLERAWWLLALPVIAWLLIPPRPRRVEATAHLPQWEAALAGLRRRRPRAFSLRLLLMLLAATCALLALLGLGVAGQPGPQRLVVLLDGSLSMAAHDGFQLARQQIETELDELPDPVDVRVLRCGGPVLRRHGESARNLHDVGVAAGSRVVDLAALAAEVADANTVVWTLTDGQGVGQLPSVGALDTFGEPAANAAVLAVRLTDHWPLPGLGLAIDVIAFGAAPLLVELQVGGAIVTPWSRPLELRAGEPRTVECELERVTGGGEVVIEVALPGDALAADDRWRLLLPPLPAPRIAVLAGAESGPFAAAAAAALAGEVRGVVVAPTVGEAVGLLLVDGGEVALVPGSARALCFGARHTDATAVAEPRAATVIDWDRTAPFLQGLDLSELRVDRWDPATLPTGPEVRPFLFARDAAGVAVPLAVVAGVASGGPVSVHFGFRLADANLALLPAFPQLLRRLFVLSHGERARARELDEPPPGGEQDLWQRLSAQSRPLPRFGTPGKDFGAWLMVAGAATLLLRILLGWLDRSGRGVAA